MGERPRKWVMARRLGSARRPCVNVSLPWGHARKTGPSGESPAEVRGYPLETKMVLKIT